MRVQYIALVAAIAYLSSIDGLQIVPYSAKSSSLRAPADARNQPYVEGKTDRFLISESKTYEATKAPTGYVFDTLHDDDDMLWKDEDNEYEDEDENSSFDNDERGLFKRRKRKKKKKKHKETLTPTPALNSTATPTPTPTPKPTRGGLLGWIDRISD
ncbi:secreted RxLR effector peptide protein, putative [Phytophthora infestans T30-4]|uniref:Uncharacterized protein n=2 Tax=Phytophthora infestans TaxID=4787 RepID=A0A8S9ULT4_PHYIN